MNSNSFRSFFLIVCVSAFAAAAFGQSQTLRDDLARSFAKFDVIRLSSSLSTGEANSNKSLSFSGTQDLQLDLVPHDMRAARYRAENTGAEGETVLERAPVLTYRGQVANRSSSSARINIIGSRIEGFFSQGGETFFVEPAEKYSETAASNEYVVYKMEDVIQADAFSCGSDLGDKIDKGMAIAGLNAPESIAGLRRIEIATEADREYVNTLGGPGQANAEILGILNTIEGLYSAQLNLSIAVVFQHTWTTADPYSAVNTEYITRSFQAYWNANYSLTDYPRDTAHLFTGKNNLLSQGWAFINVICLNPEAAYGVSGYISWAPGKYLITAHEIGHNLGANHVDTAENCSDSLMNPQLSGSTPLSFCSYSRNEISSQMGTNGSCITPGSNCRFDFDGDAKADVSIFRPGSGEWWYLKSSNGQNRSVQFGASSDRIVPGDFTGDGVTDLAFFRPSNGFWYVMRSEDSSFYSFPFGALGDIPTPADYDGDGKIDAAIFRPSTATWYISRSSGGTTVQQFGASADMPVAGDYDGDGRSDVAIYRPSSGQWWINRSQAGLVAFAFGQPGDRPVNGDYTGDGKADAAIWRPSNGFWYILRSEDGSFYSFPFGSIGDIPAPGDFDGDGKVDATIFRPATSTWYANRSTAGMMIQQFGASTDMPVPNAPVN